MEGYELVVSTDLVTPNLFFVIPLENSLHKIYGENRKNRELQDYVAAEEESDIL